MSATTHAAGTAHASGGAWIRTHPAALTIAALAVALAVTLTLLVLRLSSGPTATTTPGRASTGQPSTGQPSTGQPNTGQPSPGQDPAQVSGPPLQRMHEGCAVARAGLPC